MSKYLEDLKFRSPEFDPGYVQIVENARKQKEQAEIERISEIIKQQEAEKKKQEENTKALKDALKEQAKIESERQKRLLQIKIPSRISGTVPKEAAPSGTAPSGIFKFLPARGKTWNNREILEKKLEPHKAKGGSRRNSKGGKNKSRRRNKK